MKENKGERSERNKKITRKKGQGVKVDKGKHNCPDYVVI
jgi:hypothetical protein